MNRLKLAELTSGVEAVGQPENPLWVVALYSVVCWLLLAAVLAMLRFSNRA